MWIRNKDTETFGLFSDSRNIDRLVLLVCLAALSVPVIGLWLVAR